VRPKNNVDIDEVERAIVKMLALLGSTGPLHPQELAPSTGIRLSSDVARALMYH
jgi:hypothetical protein